MKIPKKYAGVAIGAIVSTFMGIFMSLLVTFINLGYAENFWESWLQAFISAWPIGFALSIILTPMAKSFVDKHTA